MSLGIAPGAAYEPTVRLPGTGVLLPAWRQLAQLLALLNHQVLTCPGCQACPAMLRLCCLEVAYNARMISRKLRSSHT